MSAKCAALYVRVSTDAQTVENQIRELRQVAARRGWDVVEVYSDAGAGRNGRSVGSENSVHLTRGRQRSPNLRSFTHLRGLFSSIMAHVAAAVRC